MEAPDIEDFQPVKTYKAAGTDFLSLRNADGVRLELSQAGVTAVDQDPSVAALLGRMGAFIAEHGGYKDTGAVKAAEPGNIPRVGEKSRKLIKLGYDKVTLSSVYQHDSAPSVIVKAYDYDRRSAGFQFYLGTWLHEGLASAADSISSPAQLAMFQARRFGGHRTTVTDYVPGRNLSSLAFQMRNSPAYDALEIVKRTNQITDTVHARIGEIMGRHGPVVANDVQNPANIIVADSETATPDNLLEHHLTVIDLPVVNKRTLPGLVAVRASLQSGLYPDIGLQHSAN